VLAGLEGALELIRKAIGGRRGGRKKSEASLKEYQAQLATAEDRGAGDACVGDGGLLARGYEHSDAERSRPRRAERAVKEMESARSMRLQEITRGG